MREELVQSFKDQPIVILGNEDSDMEWIVRQLERLNHQFTIYNPMSEEETGPSEQALEQYLRQPFGFLVTLAQLFNGMESAVIVLAYSNPYASDFRANFMRASVEIILLDWSDIQTTFLSQGEKYFMYN